MSILRYAAKVLVTGARNEKLTLSVYASLVGQLYGSLSAFLMLPAAGLLLTISDVLHRGAYRAWLSMIIMCVIIFTRIKLYVKFKGSSFTKKMTDVALFETGAAMTGLLMAAVIGVTECIQQSLAPAPKKIWLPLLSPWASPV